MTFINSTKSKRNLSAKLAAGIAISTILLLGTVASASAEEHRDNDHRDKVVVRGGGWDRGYYRAPPVVYAARMNMATGRP